jgi:FkbM family methyltransferase
MPLSKVGIGILTDYAQEIKCQSKRYLLEQVANKSCMISFAQNYEDVYLRRLFSNTQNISYVDVGAADPFIHSVTAYFYLSGSRGLNIDADERSYAQLCKYRPLDSNVCAFVGSDNSERIFVSHPIKSRSTGWTEYLDYDLYDKSTFKRQTLKTHTLNDILHRASMAPGFSFLKLDCEGSELEIVKSFDLLYFKPKVVIIETAKPYDMTAERKSEIADHSEEITEVMLAAGYSKVLFDGVNTWFAPTNSAPVVGETLAVPVGAHDRFIAFQALQFAL